MVLGLLILVMVFHFNKKEYYFELVGSDVVVDLGSRYVELGFRAYDSSGRDYSDEVIVENHVDSSKEGRYIIIYKFRDYTLYRMVSVVSKDEVVIGQLSIRLVGEDTVYVEKNSMYIESGAVAYDKSGNNISSEIKTLGDVNLNIPNTYHIVYSVTDLDGKVYSVSRNVIVYEVSYQYNKNCSSKQCVLKFVFKDSYYDYIMYPDGNTSKEKTVGYTVKKNGIYKFSIYDKFGNVVLKEISVNEIGVSSSFSSKPSSSSSSSKSSSSLSSSSSSNIQTKIENNLFVGDSRTVGMCDLYKVCDGDDYIAKSSMGYSWFQNTAVPSINNKISSKRYNIIILMGVNDVGGTSSSGKNAAVKYYNTVYSLTKSMWSNQNVVFVSVNPVIDGKSYAYTVAINSFNSEISSMIQNSELSNFKYCDTASSLNVTLNNAPDGLHYNRDLYQQIYNKIIDDCL